MTICDIGVDAVDQSDGGLKNTSCPMLASVKTLLQKSPYFQRYNGSDHFMIHSINQPMFFYMNAYCVSLYELCSHCLKLSIDTYSPKLYPPLKDRPYLSNNWISIPFPSSYHSTNEMTAIPWMNDNLPRPYIVSFVGTSSVTSRKQRHLRLALMYECRRSSFCFLYELPSHHMTSLRQSSESLVIDIYQKSVFCLMPGGDFATRKGLFDSLLSGCIPVIFQRRSALLQWPWHWGSMKIAETCLTYIPREVALFNISSLFYELSQMANNANMILRKRQCISAIGHQLQYNHPLLDEYESGHNPLSKQSDALDIVMQRLLAQRYL